MVTKVTIVAENDKPMALLGENANEKVKTAWESIMKLIAIQGNVKVYVESAEVWDDDQTDCRRCIHYTHCYMNECTDYSHYEPQTEKKFPRRTEKPIRITWVDEDLNALGKTEPQQTERSE